MSKTALPRLPGRSAILAACVLAVLLVAVQSVRYEMVPPRFDAARYAQYALNLHDYAAFGLVVDADSRQLIPGYANSPLYPAFLAAIVSFDANLEQSLRCAVRAEPAALEHCPRHYGLVVAAQLALGAVALCCLWLGTWFIFFNRGISWVASVLALGSGQLFIYANQLLTEILVLFWFALLLLGLVLAMQREQRRWWVMVGVLLGLLTLTRPEYLYLTYAVFGAALVLAIVRSWRRCASNAAVVALAAIITIGPWVLRNHQHFGQLAVTGGYADVIVAYRVSYNRLSLSDWTAALVYFVSQHSFEGLTRIYPRAAAGGEIETYLHEHGPDIRERALATLHGDRDRLAQYLVETEILGQPFQHLMTSVLLAVRGIMVGKYLALLGLPSLVLMIVLAWRRRVWQVFVLLFPACFMVPLYAAVSVSIPRYNVYLVYYYAIAGAWILCSLWRRRAHPLFVFERAGTPLDGADTDDPVPLPLGDR